MSKLTDSPHFRWMPGMLNTRGRRFAGMYDDYTAMYMNGCVQLSVHIKIWETAEPDTNDDATRGCLWALFCETAEAKGWEEVALRSSGVIHAFVPAPELDSPQAVTQGYKKHFRTFEEAFAALGEDNG